MRLAGNLLAMVAGLVGGVLLLELALRIAGFNAYETVPDPVVGYRFVPKARYKHTQEGFSQGRFNSHGWRDVEHAEAKPPGNTRIEILGDAYVSAFQVPLDSTFFRRLERGLNERAPAGRRFEVVALGADGNSTAVEYLTYRNWGAPYDPDVVAVLFTLNDQADNWRPTALDKARPFFVESGDSVRLDASVAGPPEARRPDRLRWLKSRSVLLATVRRSLAALRRCARRWTRPARWRTATTAPGTSTPACPPIRSRRSA